MAHNPFGDQYGTNQAVNPFGECSDECKVEQGEWGVPMNAQQVTVRKSVSLSLLKCRNSK